MEPGRLVFANSWIICLEMISMPVCDVFKEIVALTAHHSEISFFVSLSHN